MIERKNYSDLLDLLVMENSDPEGTHFDVFWDDQDNTDPADDVAQTSVSLVNAQAAIDAYIMASEGAVVGIDPVGTVTNLDDEGAAFYKTTTTPAVDADDGKPAVAGTPYIRATAYKPIALSIC